MLSCPTCHQALTHHQTTYRCPKGHSFDCAKSGYVNLYLNKKQQPGDDQLMINARHQFLNQGYYQPLCDQLNQLIDHYQPTTILDGGCGEGYYTKHFTRSTNQVYACDLSTSGLKLLNKANPQVITFVSNLFDLAVMDHSMDLIFNIFVPHAWESMIKALKPHGYLISVTGGPDHLIQLRQQLYQTLNPFEPVITPTQLKIIDTITITNDIKLPDQPTIQQLFTMTPYYYTTTIEAKHHLQQLSDLTVTTQFIITIYQLNH